jgi:hypothetical protein
MDTTNPLSSYEIYIFKRDRSLMTDDAGRCFKFISQYKQTKYPRSDSQILFNAFYII